MRMVELLYIDGTPVSKSVNYSIRSNDDIWNCLKLHYVNSLAVIRSNRAFL